MLAWINANWVTLVALAAVAGIIALAVITLVKERKKGKSACGGKCASCPYGGSCARR